MNFTILFFFIIIMYCLSEGYKIKKLTKRIKKIEKKDVNKIMSRLIKELVGKECLITFEEGDEINCTIVDYDEEWLRITYSDKKEKHFNKVVRIDSIYDVQYVAE